ncbi:MAG TPA: nitrous oxide-stimulated promoter family protein [Geobacteraceae bacterium]
MEHFTPLQKKDLKVLVSFTAVYCRARHSAQAPFALPADLSATFRRGVDLCPDCQSFLAYALERRRKCPLDPKPSCKHCHIHCYSKEYRAKVREVMAFSGWRMILRGRLDYLWHYFF